MLSLQDDRGKNDPICYKTIEILRNERGHPRFSRPRHFGREHQVFRHCVEMWSGRDADVSTPSRDTEKHREAGICWYIPFLL